MLIGFEHWKWLKIDGTRTKYKIPDQVKKNQKSKDQRLGKARYLHQ